MAWSAFLTIRCMDRDSWLSAVLGASDYMYTDRRVPRFIRFRVFFGKDKAFPDFADCKNVFRSKGSKRICRGLYVTRVKKVRGRTVV